jgi:hypothetical protein
MEEQGLESPARLGDATLSIGAKKPCRLLDQSKKPARLGK